METIKFYTLGCKVNQYDTQNIREQFIRLGFKELDNHQPADIYLINTCTVTQRADSESLNFIRRAKRENRRGFIIVTGCLTELDSDRIRETGAINLIVRNKEKEAILSHFFKNYRTREPENLRTNSGISFFKSHTRAFLKIQDGCDNFCSYCKVPFVRGRPRSKQLDEIISEAEHLAENGFKEIVLTGICLGAYGGDLSPQSDLVRVIAALEKIKGLARIRLSSIEAGDISEELINTLAQSKKLCKHLHVPVQSGDDEILKKMNRKYCRDDYLNLIKKVKSRLPQIAITTDVLVGFPAESEINFGNTIELIKEILPLKVHIFPYSRRKGTPAATNFKDEINPLIIKQRMRCLKKIAEGCSLSYRKQFLGRNMEVLIEGRLKENPCFWQGYTDNYIRVLVNSDKNLKNEVMSVRLKKILKDYILVE